MKNSDSINVLIDDIGKTQKIVYCYILQARVDKIVVLWNIFAVTFSIS